MSRDRRFSCLCRLVDDSLRPYTESEAISITKDREKDLLIALSKFLREIQLKKQELDCDSDEEDDWESDGYNTSSGKLELQHEDHNCSTKFLAVFAIFLTVESQFIQHLVGKILAVVSEFIIASGNEQDSFFPSLFICLKLSISTVLRHSTATSSNETKDQICDSSTYVVLRSRLKNANWSSVGTIVRVLSRTLKYLKEEDDEQLLEAYMDWIACFILDVPWDVMEKIQINGCDAQESNAERSHFIGTPFFFLGNFVQLLCSLVEQSCSLDAKNKHRPFLGIIIDFVDRLFKLCLGKKRNGMNLSISLYFRHKLLMLMMRLSYQTSLGYSTLTSWLQLLHDYYDELLYRPIMQRAFNRDQFFEGSPFLTSLSDGIEPEFSSSHLQRRAILIFLRCCFSLIYLAGNNSEQFGCETPNACSTFDSNPSNARKLGFLELYKWLERHLPTDISVSRKLYLDYCTGFASSFLQLYIHEDDVLFKVLLQLLSINSSLEKLSGEETWEFEDVNKDIIFQLSSIFNPVHLFHLFLAELCYDHRVILDYLISKDIGASCAEYLLRSLRVVCDSWNSFVTFSVHEKVQNLSSYKKRKLVPGGSNLQAEVSSVLPEKTLSSKQKKDVNYGSKHNKYTRNMFKEATNCLLSFKISIENLHRKGLFPYNPEVLLKRLEKLKELCSEVDNGLTAENT